MGRFQFGQRRKSPMKMFLAAASAAAAIATPAAGADEWLKDLSLQQPTLAISGDKYGPDVKATIIVENKGTIDSKKIYVDCVLFDDRENTVGNGSTTIARIKPGKKGYSEVSFYKEPDAKIIECTIEPYRPLGELVGNVISAN
jgi:hypothetical protein